MQETWNISIHENLNSEEKHDFLAKIKGKPETKFFGEIFISSMFYFILTGNHVCGPLFSHIKI